MNEDYSQPEFYRFNQDSLQLVKWIQKTSIAPKQILDLGAGSGIIGIELARVLNPETLTLVEVQAEFLPHLESNCLNFLPATVEKSICIKSFSEFKTNQQFDLIVCNPPYYLPGRGELPKNPQRAIARTFVVDSWGVLLSQVAANLSATGKGYMTLPKDLQLWQKVAAEAQAMQLSAEKFELDSILILELFRLNKN